MKYPVVLQHNEEDCGAACLATIAKFYGRIFSISRTRAATGTGQLGTTLLNLKQGARALGFNARGVKAPLELVDKQAIPLPGIIHWKGNHWVVLYGRRGQKYAIADPAAGLCFLSREELISAWSNGVMMLLEPRPDFHLIPDDRAELSGFRRFLLRVGTYRSILAEALLLNAVLGVLSLTTPFLIQILTDDVLVRGDTELLRGGAIAVLAVNFINTALKLVQSNLVTHFAQRLELDLILEFGRAILNLPLSYYETHRSGEIVSRLADIKELNQLISQSGLILPSQTFIALASAGFMLFYSPRLTLAAVVIATAMVSVSLVMLPSLPKKIRSLLSLAGENQGLLIETFQGAIVVKTLNAAGYFWEEFQLRYGRQANLTFSAIQTIIFTNIFSGLFALCGETALLWLGSGLVIEKELSIGQLLAFNNMNANCLAFIATLASFVLPLTRTRSATERLMEVIDYPQPELQLSEFQNSNAVIPGDADIVCENLHFQHPGRVELLQDFSLSIPGGKVVALIGHSGCGKSTLAKLIAGLYRQDSGNIRAGIYNLDDLSLHCRRQQIVLVPQDSHFWSRSIIENFRLGEEGVTLEQIVRACQIALADDFISKLPNKYQTILGEFGANLSGGQRQRLAIARGIVTNPPILILDESTARLDPVTESQALDRLLSHRLGKTTIVISHRPRVILRADWIVFLERGRSLLQGTPPDLLSQSGPHLDFLTP
ncbi:peptidase domain-containing ABC transporter [[Phormidium] sp. ETS-05]|uniref:peptidase domain-containing ABC transporter n=1 Tax=[Phormidium] sp. ETS-05 TaxID=222819 RepID=UPI0018EEF2A5|nr:peptidase domain-containing ABC transporter [[Phormidium] sp. ETS-05]